MVLFTGKQLFCLHSLYFQEAQPVQVNLTNNLELEHGFGQPFHSMELDEPEPEPELNSYGTVLFSLLILLTFYIFIYYIATSISVCVVIRKEPTYSFI